MSEALYQEARAYVRNAAEPRPAGDTVKAAILRAARETSLSVRRVTTLWYGQPCQILAGELEQLRDWHDQWIEREAARLSEKLAALEIKRAEMNARRRR